jgi:hypothetical protein
MRMTLGEADPLCSVSKRRELRRKEILASQQYRLPYTFSSTNTSTVARSRLFQVGSPIHARVSPR